MILIISALAIFGPLILQDTFSAISQLWWCVSLCVWDNTLRPFCMGKMYVYTTDHDHFKMIPWCSVWGTVQGVLHSEPRLVVRNSQSKFLFPVHQLSSSFVPSGLYTSHCLCSRSSRAWSFLSFTSWLKQHVLREAILHYLIECSSVFQSLLESIEALSVGTENTGVKWIN